MLQHLIVILIFAVCLYFVVRRIIRIVSSAKRGESHCDTCTEISCPLHEAYQKKNCGCGCNETKKMQFSSKKLQKSRT